MDHESLQVKTIKTVFGGLTDNEKLSLVKDLFNDTQVNVREIISNSYLLAYMVIYYPDHKSICYKGPGTKTYRAITDWCNIEKDLREFRTILSPTDRFLQTVNGILYDKVTKCFIRENLTYSIKKVNFSFDNILPETLSDSINIEFSVYYESDFPEKSLEVLEEIGAIGPQIKISSLLIED